MKKFFALLLVATMLAMAVVCMPLSALAEDNDQEMIRNGDFEADIEDTWKTYYQSIVSVSDQGRSGNALLITERSHHTDTMCHDVSAALKECGPGTYEVSAFVRLADESAEPIDLMLVVNYGTEEGENLWATTGFSTITGSDWTEVTGQIEITYSGTLNKADFYLMGQEGQEGGNFRDLLVDDCSMKPASAMEETEEVVEAEGEELLVNGGFEDDIELTWEPYVEAVIERVEDGKEGSGLFVSGRTDYTDVMKQTVTDLMNGYGPGTYEISAWIKLADENATPIGMNVVISMTDEYGGMSWPQTDYVTVNGTEWTQVTATVEANWNGSLTDAHFYIISNESREVGVYQDLYIDECSLKTVVSNETEPPVVETEPSAKETEPVAETESKAPVTEPEVTEAPETTAPAVTDTQSPAETDAAAGGCASVIGFSAVSMIALAGYGLLKKKN